MVMKSKFLWTACILPKWQVLVALVVCLNGPCKKVGLPCDGHSGSAINPLLATAEPISKMCDSPGKTYLTKGENARKAEKEKSLNSTKQKKNQTQTPKIKTNKKQPTKRLV